MKSYAKWVSLALLAAAIAAPAFAQPARMQGNMQNGGMMQGGQGMQSRGMQGKGMQDMDMMGAKGMHTMGATVTQVDARTGLIDVSASGMNLKLHFPPASLADVKAGDKITLHMAFSKP